MTYHVEALICILPRLFSRCAVYPRLLSSSGGYSPYLFDCLFELLIRFARRDGVVEIVP